MLPALIFPVCEGPKERVIWGHVRFDMVPWDLAYLRGCGETQVCLKKNWMINITDPGIGKGLWARNTVLDKN